MNIKGQIIFTYSNKKNSQIVFDTLEIDNENYIDSDLCDNQIIYSINSNSLGRFLATIDDLIASEILVEKIIETIK